MRSTLHTNTRGIETTDELQEFLHHTSRPCTPSAPAQDLEAPSNAVVLSEPEVVTV